VDQYARYNCFICGPKFITWPGKFDENIPTSPEVIGAHRLNFKPNFKFSSSFFLGGTPVPVWVCVSKSSAISSAYKNLRAHHPVRAEI